MLQGDGLRLRTLTSSSEKVNIDSFKVKKYTHFDNRVSINNIIADVMDPAWIVKHAFYPFIHFEMTFFKYKKLEKKREEKSRNIFYASHIDSYIYKYYGEILNNKYNHLVNRLDINYVATAYRNNLKGKCNIHFSKEVIDFVKAQTKAFVFVSDFTKFFDSLDHRYLKHQLKLTLDTDILSDDFYKLFKSITKFSWSNKTDIELELKRKYKSEEKIKSATKFRYFNSKEFRQFREAHENNIQYNEKDYGIPQGSGLSAVCSNIYLIDFDKKINDYVNNHNGIYRRYCDDLIIIIPFNEEVKNYNANRHIEFIEHIKNQIPRLQMEKEKTGKYIYSNNQILNEGFEPTHLDYLGFSFDGHTVKIREKSIFKFYSRAYKKVRICNRAMIKYGIKKYRKGLYKNYSHLGKTGKGYGNFLSYVTRCQKIFDENSKTNNIMEKQVKNHWKYIMKRLIKNNS